MAKNIGVLCGKKSATAKPEIAKPFQIGCFNFYPCCYPRNTKSGYKYYLGMRGACGYCKSELDSPMFRNKAEAQDFIDTKKAAKFVR